ncbi:hypothetical protein OHA25_11795 [Nonomuraea sp. NBC_00507]|uniref:hypothetical protein n=1 Tax=Nonomuraea sp. NBC_00507 TaxID=2976002 RepID=UPI002E18B36C
MISNTRVPALFKEWQEDTVNAALREIIDRRRRAAAVTRMRAMVAEGEIDFSVIDKGDNAHQGVA